MHPANDSAFVLLDFSSGPHCSIQSSFVNHMADEGGIAVSIYAEKGTVHTEYFSNRPGCQVRGAWRRDEETIHSLEVPSEYLRGFETGDISLYFRSEGPRRFIDSILDNTAVAPNFYDGYEAERIIDAALESQHSGRRITIA